MTTKQMALDNFSEDLKKKSDRMEKIFFGDITSSLLILDNSSIDCVITSPPYWNQRDYGFKGQIGNEDTVESYISKLTESFYILKKKLSEKGVFYLNIGDKYLAKYGNTPLGLIPYKLVKSLLESGWFLQDTLIWYKPNHMPSSVKNRFSNTYEPVFVLVKNEINYYKKFYDSSAYSNILNIPLQQNTYKHIATFPDNLILKLLSITNLPIKATILDPFAGSGTTAFAVKRFNGLNKTSFNSFSIEAKGEFVDIIKDRCSIDKNKIINVDYKPLSNKINLSSFGNKILSKSTLFEGFDNLQYQSSNLVILAHDFKVNENFYLRIQQDEFYDTLDDDGLFFVAIPFLDPNFLVELSKCDKWIIRNIIMRKEGNICTPIILMVKDTKLVRYKFDLDNLRIEHKGPNGLNFEPKEFIRTKVIKSSSIFKENTEGYVKEIFTVSKNNFPQFVSVNWNDKRNENYIVLNYLDVDNLVEFFCPFCNQKLEIYYLNRKKLFCSNCKRELWDNFTSIPNLKVNKLSEEFYETRKNNNHISQVSNNQSNSFNEKEKIYRGKFTLDDKINRGQSPGARMSVTEQYFFVTRMFSIKHGLFGKYLTLWLKHLKLTKKDFQERFPDSYKHTIGHWFRTDMGGSLPKIEDLILIEEKLGSKFDSEYRKLVSYCGLKYQSVLNNPQGKNPGDFINIESDEIISYFKKLV